jgi:ferrochelatase
VTVGVLVMAYGGPRGLDEVEPYLRDVRGFRETPPQVVAQVRARYARIGGRSPILEATAAQARALGGALNNGRLSFEPVVGMRHWHPYIREALAQLEQRGITRAVGLVMAPHYSRMSIGAYYRAVAEAGTGVTVAGIESWHLLPGYVAAIVDRVREALARFGPDERPRVPVIFTAHSLPERIRAWDDPYPRQLDETVAAVAARLDGQPHVTAYQSAGMTAEPWLGPDVGDALADLADRGARHAVVAPIGFVSEHVEVLYDLDVELRERAAALGVRLERTRTLDDAAPMVARLAELVRRTAEGAGWA